MWLVVTSHQPLKPARSERMVTAGRESGIMGGSASMSDPSMRLVELWVVWLGLITLGTALAIYLTMEVRHRRLLAREARRLMLSSKLFPSLNKETVLALWAESGRAERDIITKLLIDAARSQSIEESRSIERLLISLGDYAGWIRQLRHGGVKRRVRAAINLGHFDFQQGVEALAAAAEDSSPIVQLAVTMSLGRLGDPRGLPALMRLALQPPRGLPDLTLTAALAGCAKGCPARLVELLQAPQVRSRVIGAWALSEVADPTVLAPLVAAARDPEPEVRAKVARGLARLAGSESWATLERLARDPVWFVRVRALDGLGRLKEGSSEATVREGLEDKVREVRYRAAWALRQIRGMRSEAVGKVLATGSRRSFSSLISEWDRAGFLWELAGGLSTCDWRRFVESQDVVKALIRAGMTRAFAHFILVFPDLKVRLRLVRLLREAASPEVRAGLLALAAQPGCDPRVAAKIREAAPTAAIL